MTEAAWNDGGHGRGFAQLTVAAGDEGLRFTQLTVAGRDQRGSRGRRIRTTGGGWPGTTERRTREGIRYSFAPCSSRPVMEHARDKREGR